MKSKKKIWLSLGLFIIGLTVLAGSTPEKSVKYDLPAPVLLELKHLEETYRVLDFSAKQIWPGWENYRDFPFQFHFENGLTVLIGHPNPPQGYELLENIDVSGKTVHIDRRKVSSLPLTSPLAGGGGILPFGYTDDHKPIKIVDITFSPVKKITPETSKTISDNQVLIFIHELFHLFQDQAVKLMYGNLMYNPDTNYAYYSGIEAIALEKAYLEPDTGAAKLYIKDFLVARELKRKASMTDLQAKEESSDDLREGTAVYSEVRTLEILKTGYKPGISTEDDPYYSGFKDIDSLLKKYMDNLRESEKNILDSKGKCYFYGCFQGLLLQRLYPDWQKQLADNHYFLYDTLRKQLPVNISESVSLQKRWEKLYEPGKWKAQCKKEIDERDRYYKLISGRKGKCYIINFKPIKEFVPVPEGKKHYSMGLCDVYPQGIGDIKIDDIEITGLSCPLEKNELYHLKIVDTGWKQGKKPYTLYFEKQIEEGVYANAIVTTPLFTLKAPKLKIKESGKRIKFIILSRVKEPV